MSDSNCQPDNTPGIFSWNELATTDVEKCTEFYSKLFGWTAEVMDMPGGQYTMFKVGDRPAAGMLKKPDECDAPPCWLSYINVDNIEESVAKAKDLGGEILKEITEIPGMGKFSVIKDPTGAVFSFWQSLGQCCS